MKVIDLIERLLKPVALIAVLCVAATFAANYLQGQSDSLDFFLRKLDIRHEGSLATWFESCLFLLCGMSFAVLGWKQERRQVIPNLFRYVLILAALGCIFASADESATIHESLEIRVRHSTGIPDEAPVAAFLFLYAPVVLTGLVVITYILGKLISRMPGPKGPRRLAKVFLLAAVVAIPAVMLLESLEYYCNYYSHWPSVMLCLEETMELVAILGFLGSNHLIARSYEPQMNMGAG